eukprot:7186145-Pyramimonas_sp.AAC.1
MSSPPLTRGTRSRDRTPTQLIHRRISPDTRIFPIRCAIMTIGHPLHVRSIRTFRSVGTTSA